MTKGEVAIFRLLATTYERKRFLLSASAQSHFFFRSFVATDDAKHLKIFAEAFFSSKKTSLKENIRCFQRAHFPLKRKNLKGTPLLYSERHKLRQILYHKYPAFPYFTSLLNTLFFIDCFHANSHFPDYEFGQEIVSQEKWAALLTDPEVLEIDSSFAVNAAYQLSYLLKTTLYKDAEKVLRNFYRKGGIFFDASSLSDAKLYTAFYTLTHIVIAGSHFYQRPALSPPWVFRYFEKWHSYAKKRLSADILTEIALCYRLAQKTKTLERHYQLYRKEAIKRFSKENLHQEASFKQYEHTASVLLLLLAPGQPWKSGVVLPAPPPHESAK